MGFDSDEAVLFEHVALAFDDNVVLRDISFAVPAGHMAILIGESGSGKSVILKLILGLLKPDSGAIHVNGERIDAMTETQMMRKRADIGMLFQESALFDSLTVAENVGYRFSMPSMSRRIRYSTGMASLQSSPRSSRAAGRPRSSC